MTLIADHLTSTAAISSAISSATSNASSAAVFEDILEKLARPSTSFPTPSGPVPTQQQVSDFIDAVRQVLLPWYHEQHANVDARHRLGLVRETGRVLIERALLQEDAPPAVPGRDADTEIDAFLDSLPEIKRKLELDVEAALRGDPATESSLEVVLAYPGVAAMLHYRVAHQLHQMRSLGPLLPRMISTRAHSTTGIDIHPAARIGDGFFIDHGTGVVIGGTAIIGNNVRLYHGVTLGSRSFPKDSEGKIIKGLPRHPIVEDDVVIYAHATVLGRVTIGSGAVIGGNVWVTSDVAPNSQVLQARSVRTQKLVDGDGI